MDENICVCLYRVLGLSKENYTRDIAKERYSETAIKIKQLRASDAHKALDILNLARDTFNNLNREEEECSRGTIKGVPHDCESDKERISIISNLDDHYNHEIVPISEKEAGVSGILNIATATINHNTINKDDDVDTTIEQILGHKFRGDTLKFRVIIKPGDIELLEHEDTVVVRAGKKVGQYLHMLKKEKKKSLSYLIGKRPYLLKLM